MSRARRTSLRPLLTRLHFYAGVLVAPFIMIAAISGALYAITPSLEPVIHSEQMRTDSRGPTLPISEQIAAARQVQPDLPLLAVRPAEEEGQTTRVLFDDGRTEDSRRLAVFIDPVTAQSQGELTAYGSSGSLPVRTWIDEFHRGLHLGEPGRLYSELAASWLGVIVIAGLVLWWTGPRRKRRLRPERTGSPRRRLLSWHGALGTWAAIGFLALSATGLTWSTYAGANVTGLREALNWTTPTVATSVTGDQGAGEHAEHGAPASEGPEGEHDPAGHEDHNEHGQHGDQGGTDSDMRQDEPGIGFDGALSAARDEHDIQGPVEIRPPGGDDGTYVVQEIDASWPSSVDAVSLAADGEVIDVVRFEDYSVAAKLARWGVDGHMGLLFGIWNQIGLVLLAAALVTMTLWGYRMWWRRRPTRGPGANKPGAPPERGAWRQASPWQIAAVAAVAITLGLIMPVFGISLLVFLAIDLLVGWRRRSQEPPDRAAPSGA